VSFPLGAAIGIIFDLPEKIIVILMSFGAGALVSSTIHTKSFARMLH